MTLFANRSANLTQRPTVRILSPAGTVSVRTPSTRFREFHRIDDFHDATQVADASGKVGRAAGPIAGRFLIPDESGKQVVSRPYLDARRVEHPKIASAEHVEVGGWLAESADLVSHFGGVGELMKSLHPVVPGEGYRLRDKICARQLLVEVCRQLRTEDLVELLKYPFCTGEAEHIVLNQLKATTGPDFGGNLWKFVEQADSLSVKDIGSPAKRPSVQDALKVHSKNADGK
jgi:hypothetical protein